MKFIHFLLLSFFMFLGACKPKTDTAIIPRVEVVDFKTVQKYYINHIELAIQQLDSLDTQNISSPKNIIVFKELRSNFKKSEPYAGCLCPKAAHRVNGPALPIFREGNGKLLDAIGLQRMEESIFLGEDTSKDFQKNIEVTKGMLSQIKGEMEYYKLNPQRFFIATHQQLLRIISFSMAGFDTPESQWGIREAVISLQSLLFVYKNSIQSIIKKKQASLDTTFVKNIDRAIVYAESNLSYQEFDRFVYIRDYVNPITKNWVAIRKQSDLWNGKMVAPFNLDAPTFFDNNSWNVKHFASDQNQNPSDAQILLGKKLFFDKNVSKGGKLACVTCHIPNKGYADGLQFSLGSDGKPLDRNTPTLMNSIFQKSFFLDGRSESLESQITNVFRNKKEFNTKAHQFSDDILKDSTYITQFTQVFGKQPKSNRETILAISSYVATLNGFNSKFDKNIRGEADNMSDSEKKGFNLFMGKALCATCHFMPLTNGTVPPYFIETEKEVIGVPATSKNKKVDKDSGFYALYKEKSHWGMFKTPTLRNIELTAPYMHNGVYNTLEEVVDFYSKGGGAGLGFNLPHQTLPFDNLQLSEAEMDAIVAFMKTLTDENLEY